MSIVKEQQYTPFVKQYIAGVASDYSATMNSLKQDYDTAQVNMDMLDEALRTVPFRTDDEAQRLELTNKYKKQIQDIASVGDLENRKYQTNKLLKGFEGDYNIYGKRYLQDQQADLEADKLRQAGHTVYKRKSAIPTFKGVDEKGLPMYNDWKNKWLNYNDIEKTADSYLKPVLDEIQKLTNSQTQDVYTDENGNVWAVTSSGQRFNINNPKTAQEKAVYNRLKNVYLPAFEKDQYGQNYTEIARQQAIDAGMNPQEEDMFGDIGRRKSFDLLLSRLPAVNKSKVAEQLLLKGEDNGGGRGSSRIESIFTDKNNDISKVTEDPIGAKASSVLENLATKEPNGGLNMFEKLENFLLGVVPTNNITFKNDRRLTEDEGKLLRDSVRQFYTYDAKGKPTNAREAYSKGIKYLQVLKEQEKQRVFAAYNFPDANADSKTFNQQSEYKSDLTRLINDNLATLPMIDYETGQAVSQEEKQKLSSVKKEEFNVLGDYLPSSGLVDFIPEGVDKDNFYMAHPVDINGKRYIVGNTSANIKNNKAKHTSAKLDYAEHKSSRLATNDVNGNIVGAYVPITDGDDSNPAVEMSKGNEITSNGYVPTYTFKQGYKVKKFVVKSKQDQAFMEALLSSIVNEGVDFTQYNLKDN